ncbi:MAG: L-rhamnose/proton symporter RhaT [Phycisphaerae bacterium]
MSTVASANPYIAVTLQWIGGLGSASFYLPFLRVRRWSWETYWLVGGFFSWIVAPLVFAAIFVPDVMNIFQQVSGKAIFWTYFFGVLWGLGSLTFGLTLRYLGIGLGMAVALSYTAAFGTLIPPCVNGAIGQLVTHAWGLVTMLGVAVCLAGIGLSGAAGWAKERELAEDKRKAVVQEYNFRRGMLVASFSGIMSACINFGFAGLDGFNAVKGQNSITAAAAAMLVRHGQRTVCEGLPTLIIVLAGGFTTNLIWCIILHLKNSSGRQYIARFVRLPGAEGRIASHQAELGHPVTASYRSDTPGAAADSGTPVVAVPLLNNYVFASLAGVIWYLQFFFYTAGQSFMPVDLAFSGWTLHMASVIIFATLWGVVRHEWKGTSRRTHLIIAGGVSSLIAATLIVGGGNLMKSRALKGEGSGQAAPMITAHH